MQCKHGFLVQWRKVIHPKRVVITAIMRLLIFVTIYRKTYTNDFRFSNSFPFTSSLCQLFEWLGQPFARNSPFEWLPHLLVRNINPFKWLSYTFVRNIKPFKRLGHPFVEDIRSFERFGHLYYGIPLNFLWMTCMGDELCYSFKKIHLFEPITCSLVLINVSRFVWLHLHKFISFKLLFLLLKTTRVQKRGSWSGFFFRCSRLWAFQRPRCPIRRKI